MISLMTPPAFAARGDPVFGRQHSRTARRSEACSRIRPTETGQSRLAVATGSAETVDFQDRHLIVSTNVARMVQACLRSTGPSGKRKSKNTAVANRLDLLIPRAKKK